MWKCHIAKMIPHILRERNIFEKISTNIPSKLKTNNILWLSQSYMFRKKKLLLHRFLKITLFFFEWLRESINKFQNKIITFLKDDLWIFTAKMSNNVNFGVHFGRTSICLAVEKDGRCDVVANDAGKIHVWLRFPVNLKYSNMIRGRWKWLKCIKENRLMSKFASN